MKRLYKRFRSRLVLLDWRSMLLYGGLLGGAGTLLWFSLGSLVGGYSAGEEATLAAGSSWKVILEHPLNAPFNILARLLLYFDGHSLLATRLAATVLGLAAIIAFYLVVRLWHGERTAFFASVLFGCSAWFLHSSRLGSASVLMLGLFLLVAAFIWYKHSNGSAALNLTLLVGAGLLYAPGMIWFIALGVFWQRKLIWQMLQRNRKITMIAGVGLGIFLAPLGWAAYQDPAILKALCGLPASGWPLPLDILRNLAQIPLSLFWQTPADAELWLARLPLLDVFSLAMLTLGGYVYWRHPRLERTKLVLAGLVIGLLLISAGGAVSILLLMPFIYVLIAAGLSLLVDKWFIVFPRNAFAKVTCLFLISLAVLATASYGLRHYFVAWPNAPETQPVFRIDSRD